MITMSPAVSRMPLWLWTVAAMGVAWNVLGLVQLFDFLVQTRASLMMKGMSPPAANLYYGLPTWMKLAFAVGSIGGLAGSLTLAARQRAAIPMCAASLAGYVLLYLGDLHHGVFDVIPGQMAILSLVVAVACALLAAAWYAGRRRCIT